jgi:hypothetical protein
MAKFSKELGTAAPNKIVERTFALQRSDRADSVFDALVKALEEAPEALSLEYSEDFLCDLVRSYAPDVTTEEIVAALDVLSARVVALRDFMQNEHQPQRERT